MTAQNSHASQYGTELAGFRIQYAPGGHSLRLHAWGFWTSDIAEAFGRAATTACLEVLVPIDFVFDASDLKPQNADGQAALRSMMKGLAPLRFSNARVIVSNLLTRMQLTRLARECSASTVLRFEDGSTSV
jgi:hypothetical protein